MSDKFTEGVLYECDQCGRPVRLKGNNDVVSWTCLPCRTGEQPTLLEDGDELEEHAEYDPHRVRIPY